MRNISDVIEAHLKQIIDRNKHKTVEIKRSEIAEQFSCVPSQINYVINTRFTPEKGYHVESKRGGGGYIRIQRMVVNSKNRLIDELIELVTPTVEQRVAIAVIERLYEQEYISVREANLMIRAIDREVLALNLPLRDELRSRILVAMLRALKHN
ncbi:CtsR family transcriptional regulator [Amphibacillus xylanus]|uniref:Transcriptional regulator CtsR n=1 Tax=Amphibacillus xylanus (strain ATCC 51415 / DSM 6626 / JCM 7361 / LMG 17667 / NBRC 15112 / Ep01) TaxID=698758 RepID=K0J164_AMPXN|nr:CtsR family transcriptional regulator [Amphibacillus xylanus]BAM46226.1 transcriptional regulator CtsR [Amphibacillus xylanus NBRC 15112]